MAQTYPSLSALITTALGQAVAGPGRCRLCAAPTDREGDLPDSSLLYQERACLDPSSNYLCPGCRWMLTSQQKRSPQGKPMMWSWYIRPDRLERYALCTYLGGEQVQRDRPRLRQICLAPAAPCGLVVVSKGRLHTWHRGRVWYGVGPIPLCLDGDLLWYTPAALEERLAQVRRLRRLLPYSLLQAATGGADLQGLRRTLWLRLLEQPTAEADLLELPPSWFVEPLTRLALLLSDPPEKEKTHAPQKERSQTVSGRRRRTSTQFPLFRTDGSVRSV
jgi:hypothetical protein